ncbi:MAG: beta keto-acyl synthase [Proteobacteria bacterium]|nr:beta keto-acyl synthase [Pseudomonadota bacterium]
MSFEPIAVVGQSCVFPGALNPQELWDRVLAGENLLSKVPDGYWRIDPRLVMSNPQQDAKDITWTDQGGYVRGFESVFNPNGFAIPADKIMEFDPLVHWVLHTAREALKDAGYSNASDLNAGIIFGNLSYPSHTMSEFAESVWLEAQGSDFFDGQSRERAGVRKPNPLNRFMSGLPAHIVARALELNAGAFAIDASCASSLFAIKTACDRLHDGKADLMLAGGVNRADDLIIHIGFCTLQAMSQTGRSRPFHNGADGLVPCEGAGIVALKRLQDAVEAGDHIHAVIRSVGLSNDGKGHGLLVPSEEGQVKAMKKAYEISGINPSAISLLECHATGTVVGDAIEIRSSSRIFKGVKDIPAGTIKSNMGHPITASGVAGLLKVIGAMKAGIRPPTLHVDEPAEALKGTPLRLLTEAEPWPSKSPRLAAISNFGFGGNNAHLIVEEWDDSSFTKSPKTKPIKPTEIAIVGMGAMVADGTGIKDFSRTIFSGEPALSKQDDGTMAGTAQAYELPLMGLRFFPAALDQTLPQQLLMLKATLEAIDEVKTFPNKHAGAFVGMGCDGEVTRSGMCWRLPQFVSNWLQTDEITDEIKEWIEAAKDNHINPAREASAVLGAMPNIVANRLCSQFDLEGQSLTVSSEELSGVRCLELAIRALRSRELDAAVVGAVDISCESVHVAATDAALDKARQVPGDAAITLVLKRLADAKRDGDKIYAVFSDESKSEPTLKLGLDDGTKTITPFVGHSHAASGLLHIAAAALSCYHRALPAEEDKQAIPWLVSSSDSRKASVTVNALGGESATAFLNEDTNSPPGHLLLEAVPNLYIYSGQDRNEILKNLEQGNESDKGPARLVLVTDNSKLDTLQSQAKFLLENEESKNSIEFGTGIYFCDRPFDGELAFVFTGAAGAYPGMGRDLLLALPELIEDVVSRFGLDKEPIGWAFNQDAGVAQNAETMLWGSSFLSQIHAVVSQKYFGLSPKAALGFSSGESNSLFAMGAWTDMGQMAAEFHEMGVFTREVGGDCNAIKKAWKSHGIDKVDWANWGVLAPVDEVRKALESEPLACLTVIHAPEVVVIGGQADSCNRVIDKIGRDRAQPLDFNIANHCPEVQAYADDWRKLHHRTTHDIPGVRFYTASTCSHYHPTADKAADAILGMATRELDFPEMVKNAWDDGVRIFLEHGPGTRCTQSIGRILGDKKHLAVSMDHGAKQSVEQAIHAMAQLKSAGIPIDHNAFMNMLLSPKRNLRDVKQAASTPKSASRTYHVHPPKTKLPPITPMQKDKTTNTSTKTTTHDPSYGTTQGDTDRQVMAPAPQLPSTMHGSPIPNATVEYRGSGDGTDKTFLEAVNNPMATHRDAVMDGAETFLKEITEFDSPMGNILKNIVNQNAYVSKIHQDFVTTQSEVHRTYLDHRQKAVTILINSPGQEIPSAGYEAPANNVIPFPSQPMASIEQNYSSASKTSSELSRKLADSNEASVQKTEAVKHLSESKFPLDDPLKLQFTNPEYIEPTGPTFTQEQLEILASGKISDVFGPMFKVQDDYPRQVRLPEYPLLLADRITGLDAEPGSMGKGIIWTETDVKADAWYIQEGYMPAGITVEAGQCDLALISYLGADFKNKGERVYRLLGCDLMYCGIPPRVGDTLCYQIHVDGHANIGDTRIFFFHYDCRINGEIALSVRNAQAGFFTDDELAASGGVLWDPETGEHKPDDEVTIMPPVVESTRKTFSKEQVRLFTEGRTYECFGPGFEKAETHSKTPRLETGMMLLIDEVTEIDSKGGPWGRGYIKVENNIPPDVWYLTCHFKDDPCMPGTLMTHACAQAMAFYMAAMGYTLDRDGWRFDLIPGLDEIVQIKCRGQVTPGSKHLIYEVFIEEFELVDGLYPTAHADILATCDGLKILYLRRVGIQLTPTWPLDGWPHLLDGHEEKRPVAKVGDMEFGYKSLLACAFGKPSEAFGELATVFDTGRHIARLPSPPYHFMTRVSKIDATMGGAKTNESIEVEYDVPSDAWYFDKNGYPTMPFCIIMEVGLQPCGWLAVFEGGPGSSEHPLYFRNLDGTGTIHKETIPTTGIMRTRTTLTNIARIAGVTLVNFDVELFVEDELVYDMKTGFGFFPAEALTQQVGLGATEDEIKWLDEPNDFHLDLTKRPERYCGGKLRLSGPMLLMIDRVTGYWPNSNDKGLPRLRAEKSVNVSEWFFKAHFFHDPVQPGSLGVESIVQTLQFYMIHENLHEGMKNPRFEPIALNNPVTWKYRGQVTIDRKRILVELNILDKGKDEKGAWALAEGWLWADDLRIFSVKNLKIYIVEGDPSITKSHLVKSNKNSESVKSFESGVKNKVGILAGVQPEQVRLNKDKTAAICDSMPLTLYPVIKDGKEIKDSKIQIGEPFLDFDRMLAYSREVTGRGSWIAEKFTQGLCKQFTRNLILEDPEAFKKVQGRSLLYLGNHQVQVESAILPAMLQVLCERRVVTIAKSDHLTGWIGLLDRFVYSHPQVIDLNYPKNIVYFNQNDRKSMFDIIDDFKARIIEEGISVFLHVEGKLGLSCRNPVKNLSSVFVDLAKDCDLSIVPVRFVGGLPTEEMKTSLDFPLGYSKQDYYIGRPISIEELEELPYADRRRFVINAINNLGPSNDDETPNPPNPDFEKAVKSWMVEKDVSESQAVVFKTLESVTEETDTAAMALIKKANGELADFDNDEEGQWLSDVAYHLYESKL